MGRLIFFVREAFRAMRRNGAPTMAAIVTTVVTVILLGVLIPIFQTAQGKSDQINNSLEVRVAIYDDATGAEIAKLREQLVAIPHVDSVQLITKAEALAELRQSLGKEKSEELLAQIKSNPLPRNFALQADAAENIAAIEAAVVPTGADGKPRPISPIIQRDNPLFQPQTDVEKIAEVTSALKIVLSVMTALLVVASLMLVGNTIRLSIYTRRREVEVMRLVGATRWFIRWPFMIEGVVVGFVGGLLAILVLWIGKVTIVDPLGDTFAFLAAQNNISFPTLVVVLFAASVLVSAIGSGVTLRRFLKV